MLQKDLQKFGATISSDGWSDPPRGPILQPLKALFAFTPSAKWWQGLEIKTKSRCSLGIATRSMFSRLTASSQRAMSERAQGQALKIRALHEGNAVTQGARCPAPGRVAVMALTEVDSAPFRSCAKPQQLAISEH